MNLPNPYIWLPKEPGPKMVLEFLKLYGLHEAPGASDNPDILAWAKELGIKDYVHDEEPWCGLFMALIAKRADKVVPANPLWAKNWANFGHKVADGAKLGDVLVFNRPGGGGHVCLYIGEDNECYHCGGGNQSDAVSIIRKPKDRIYAIRRPDYDVMPENVRKVILASTGAIDNKED
jgi:uncharacterized protein (TIGR02594 family)